MEIQSITEQLLYATVRIETSTPAGGGTGTAFIYVYEHDDGRQWAFLVTNKHVIADATEGRFFFTQKGANEQPLVGQRFDINMGADFINGWHGHPDPAVDITIMPLGQVLRAVEAMGNQVYFRSISSYSIPTSDQAKDLDAVEDVTFIGYPNGIYDVKNLMPIVRRGITATPFQIDYNGEPKFLIDASVFPGSSGSPVFIANSGGYMDRSGSLVLGGGRLLFLGVIAEVAIAEERGAIDFEPIPTARVPIVRMNRMLNLGIVYKSSTVAETVTDLLRAGGVITAEARPL